MGLLVVAAASLLVLAGIDAVATRVGTEYLGL